MQLSLRRLTVENFRGVRSRQVLDFSDTPPGLYFIRGINKADARLGSNGSGKALWDELQIETPTGSRRWGDLKAGDFVFGSDGNPTLVTARHPQGVRKLFRVLLDDGTSTVCNEDHLWTVYTGSIAGENKGKEYTVPTRWLMDRGLTRRKGLSRWRLPRYAAVSYNYPENLPIDPYVLGYWIGDGGKTGRLTVHGRDQDVIDRLISADVRCEAKLALEEILVDMPELSIQGLVSECRSRKITTRRGYPFTYQSVWNHLRGRKSKAAAKRRNRARSRGSHFLVTLVGLQERLRGLCLEGLGSHERYIPDLYMRASLSARRELLRGLMDSDGYCSRSGTVSFSSTSSRLIQDFGLLVRSLGGKVQPVKQRVGKYRDKNREVRICRVSYSVGFCIGIIPFFGIRKRLRCLDDIEPRYLDRWIRSIDYVGEDFCSCISVAAADGLFLANDFIITHNSTLFAEALIWALTGRTSRSQRPGASVENRVAGGRPAIVIVELVLDGVPHRVERTRNPNNLDVDGKKVDQLDLRTLIPLTDTALRKSILIDQFGEMFLSLGPEDKSRIFTETLDLDKWIKASDAAGDEASACSRNLESVARRSEGNIAALAEARDQREVALKAETAFEDDLEQKLAIAKTKLAEARTAARKQAAALEAARQRQASLVDIAKTRELNDQRVSLKRLQGAAVEAAGQVARSRQELGSLDSQLAKYKAAALLCPECGQPVGREHIKEKRQGLQDQILEQKGLLDRYESGVRTVAAEIGRVEKKISQLEAQLEEGGRALAETAAAVERSLTASRDEHRLHNELDELRKQANPFMSQCDALEARIAKLRAEGKKLKDEQADLERQIAIYQFWQKGFREIRLQLIDDTLIELELAVNRHAESLGLEGWRVEFATERETKRGTVSHRFSVVLHPPGEGPVDWDTYCGGEVQRWQLATTFGLAEVLLARAGVSPDFEILDEPTSHLSQEGIDELLLCLSDRAYELNRRVFLIDHNSLDRGAFDGVVTVIKTAERGTYIDDDGGVLSVQKSRKERVVL